MVCCGMLAYKEPPLSRLISAHFQQAGSCPRERRNSQRSRDHLRGSPSGKMSRSASCASALDEHRKKISRRLLIGNDRADERHAVYRLGSCLIARSNCRVGAPSTVVNRSWPSSAPKQNSSSPLAFASPRDRNVVEVKWDDDDANQRAFSRRHDESYVIPFEQTLPLSRG